MSHTMMLHYIVYALSARCTLSWAGPHLQEVGAAPAERGNMCMCMYICIYIYIYMCVYVCVYVYTCIYIYIHVYTHLVMR